MHNGLHNWNWLEEPSKLVSVLTEVDNETNKPFYNIIIYGKNITYHMNIWLSFRNKWCNDQTSRTGYYYVVKPDRGLSLTLATGLVLILFTKMSTSYTTPLHIDYEQKLKQGWICNFSAYDPPTSMRIWGKRSCFHSISSSLHQAAAAIEPQCLWCWKYAQIHAILWTGSVGKQGLQRNAASCKGHRLESAQHIVPDKLFIGTINIYSIANLSNYAKLFISKFNRSKWVQSFARLAMAPKNPILGGRMVGALEEKRRSYLLCGYFKATKYVFPHSDQVLAGKSRLIGKQNNWRQWTERATDTRDVVPRSALRP